MTGLLRAIKALVSSDMPTVWDLNDDEACSALEELVKTRQSQGGRMWTIDFGGNRMGRWDQALHVEIALASGLPRRPRILVYFPGHKKRIKKLLRISGLSSTGALQKDIHNRLQESGELVCKLMIYDVDNDALYCCIRHGLYIELRWAEAVASSLGQGAETVLRPPCMFLSEQDGYSNTRAMFLLTAKVVRGDVDGFIHMKATDEIKWVIGDRMTANTRPEPAPRRQPKYQSRDDALYEIQQISVRAAGPLQAQDLFGSDDDGVDEDESGEGYTTGPAGSFVDDENESGEGYTTGPAESLVDVKDFDDSPFVNETEFNTLVAKSRNADAVIQLDARNARHKPLGIQALPLKGAHGTSGTYVAYDDPSKAMAERVLKSDGESEHDPLFDSSE